jgi:ABC-2 type transport system permease protein
MSEHVLSATEWARTGTTLAVWMLLPLVIGVWRISRNEIS